MDKMQNGGSMGSDGQALTGDVSETNDGTGGNWENFSTGDQDAQIATLNGDTIGDSWIADNQGANNK